LYDRRVWVKDPCWANSRWHSNSYRAVDEFEYAYVFWKPGITKVDRTRLSPEEWSAWGSRAVWDIPSVRQNDDHEAKFPIELPRRFIRLFTDPGDLVLDPFMGSGTTGIAASTTGRDYIGFELDSAYAALARKRIAQAIRSMPRGLFDEEQARPAAESHPPTTESPHLTSSSLTGRHRAHAPGASCFD
jgi:site-specific DNA-methyltransferase (adenine-specific)